MNHCYGDKKGTILCWLVLAIAGIHVVGVGGVRGNTNKVNLIWPNQLNNLNNKKDGVLINVISWEEGSL